MKNNMRITSEKFIFFVGVLIVASFIFSLPSLYDKVRDIKYNGLFPKNPEEIEKEPDDTPEPIEEVSVTTTCTRSETNEGGKILYKVVFSHPNGKLKSVIETTEYTIDEGKTMEKLETDNIYYSELNADFRNYRGFTLTNKYSEEKTTIKLELDLSLLDIKAMNKAASFQPLELKYSFNQKAEEIKQIYTKDGYVCN
ncbi:MAG: hypothetical protein PHO63_00430 [Bacilli bacterium]|nr:hypothetical protein [Bacilli bacterium]MDD4808959.1 hypothetical protein [Bacilli bacterium]